MLTSPPLTIADPKSREQGTAFGCPRLFSENEFVYTVVSPRAGDLSIGVNMNPNKLCNFDCVYCEVNRREHRPKGVLQIEVMAKELENALDLAYSGEIRQLA